MTTIVVAFIVLVLGKLLYIFLKNLGPEIGSYVNQQLCSKCKKYLTDNQIYYSNGRCPLCGHRGEQAGTIVDVDNICMVVTEKKLFTYNCKKATK